MKKVIILIGAPGSGKGTQSKILKDYYNIAHLSIGDMLREEVANKSEIGLKIQQLLSSGTFVDDNTVTALLKQRLKNRDCANGFVLDGYPRTIAQAEMLNSIFIESGINNNYFVFEIDILENVLLKRILGRYTCSSCGTIYNKYYTPTKQEGICDICGSKEFTIRTDDTEEILKIRLDTYKKQVKPILEYYSSSIHKIDGLLSIEESKNAMVKIVG